jgi:hypothetical protein
MDVTSLTHFLGWVTLIHVLAYAISAAMYLISGSQISGFYARLSKLDTVEVQRAWFWLLGLHKILIWTFFLVPYLVLRLSA